MFIPELFLTKNMQMPNNRIVNQILLSSNYFKIRLY